MCQKKRFMCVYRSLSFFLKTLVFFKDTKKYILGIKCIWWTDLANVNLMIS